MKIFRKFLPVACAVALCGFVSACSDDDDPQPEPNPDDGGGKTETEVKPTAGVEVTAFYYGDYNDNQTGNFAINFQDNTLVWDEDEEAFTGTGNLLYFEFNSTLASNPDLAELAVGEYTVDADETYALNTFSCTVQQFTDGVENAQAVSAGSVKVEKAENGMYVFSGKFTLADNSTYDFAYTGNVRFLNRTGEGYLSNLTGNVEVKGMTQCAALMWGETFTETSDYCSVIIAGPDYDLTENFGTSPALNLGLNITPGSTAIPAGTYEIIDAATADDYPVFTALSGVYESTYGGYFGCWYFAPQIEGAMLTGKVVVADNGNGKYTFTVDLADGYGHTVKGSYAGNVAFYN